MRTRLIIEFGVSTPLYLSGANQERAEIRAASIKGALRHWYRALDPKFCKEGREAALFGGVGKYQGQSPILLATEWDGELRTMRLGKDQLSSFNVGSGVETKNGVVYLGYTFFLGDNVKREAIRPGFRFRLICKMPRPRRLSGQGAEKKEDRKQRHALLASLWLLGHVGGLGSRARRGFGSLEILSWEWLGEGKGEADEIMEKLPLLHDRRSPAEWLESFSAAVTQMDEWFGWSRGTGDHPRLGKALRVVILPAGRLQAKQSSYPWALPLQTVGLEMQRFRSGREPDRGRVREHLAAGRGGSGEILQSAPERTMFGLPLTFRFKNAPPPSEIEFLPAEHRDVRGEPATRHPSPLWIRATRIGGKLHPMITRLDGALPGDRGVRYKEKNRHRGRQADLRAAEEQILKEFMDRCAREGDEWNFTGRGGR
jgi:CRISPR-associated protein Cmr1